MDCSEALDLLYYSFDGLITPSQQAALEGHRRTCYACSKTLIKAERMQDLLHHVPQLHVPRGLEDRLVRRVLAQTGGVLTVPKPERPAVAWTDWRSWLIVPNWKPVAAFAGAAAAAVALLFFGRGAVQQAAFQRPADETVNAVVVGAVQDVAPNNRATQVAETSTPISSGETLSNGSAKPATVAVSTYLAVTLTGGSQVHVDRLKAEPSSGFLSAVLLHLDRGQIRVREVLHRDTSPVRVATNEATIVPTGTVFTVNEKPKMTHLTVQEGSVAVTMPGRTFSIIAGHGVRITASGGVLRDQPANKHAALKHGAT